MDTPGTIGLACGHVAANNLRIDERELEAAGQAELELRLERETCCARRRFSRPAGPGCSGVELASNSWYGRPILILFRRRGDSGRLVLFHSVPLPDEG